MASTNKQALFTTILAISGYWIAVILLALNAGFSFTNLVTWHQLKPYFLCIPSFTIVAISFRYLSIRYNYEGALARSKGLLWISRAYLLQIVILILLASTNAPLIPITKYLTFFHITINPSILRIFFALGLFTIVYLIYNLLNYSENSSGKADLTKIQGNLIAELSLSLVDQICHVLEVDSASIFLRNQTGRSDNISDDHMVAALGLPIMTVSGLLNKDTNSETVKKELQKEHKSIYAIPILSEENNVIGTILIANKRRRPLSLQDRRFLHSLAEQTSRTITSIKNIIDDVKLSAIKEERSRLSREMHDGLSPLLAYVRYKIELAKRLLNESDQDPLSHTLEEIDSVINEAFADVRESITGLRCSLADSCLIDQIETCLEQLRKLSSIEIKFNHPTNVPELCPEQEIQVLRIVQEVLTNIRKHANASLVTVDVKTTENNLVIRISDNGKGFDTSTTKDGHFGLSTMQERSQEINAILEIDSTIGLGTVVSLTIPLMQKEFAVDGNQGTNSRRPRPISGGSSKLNFVEG